MGLVSEFFVEVFADAAGEFPAVIHGAVAERC
jgi:hypothetical protein